MESSPDWRHAEATSGEPSHSSQFAVVLCSVYDQGVAPPQNQESSGQGPTDGRATNLSNGLPRRRRGYDCAATDELLGALATKHADLEQKCVKLQEHAAELEAELARLRVKEELVSTTILSATSYAMRIKEDARHDAELALRKAKAKVRKGRTAAERLAQDREDAERELLRLRQLTHDMQTRLASFLTTALQQLPPGAEDEPQPTDHEAPHVPSARVDQALATALEAALQPEKR
jgi:cell division septum initiation protein DivIVA